MGSEGDVPTVPVADLVRAVASTAYEELRELVRWLPLPHQATDHDPSLHPGCSTPRVPLPAPVACVGCTAHCLSHFCARVGPWG